MATGHYLVLLYLIFLAILNEMAGLNVKYLYIRYDLSYVLGKSEIMWRIHSLTALQCPLLLFDFS